jgi:hypothetical protein
LYKYGCELAVIKEQFCNPTRYVVCIYQSNKFYIKKEEENLDQKSPGPPSWGLMQQASPLLIDKKEIAKKPIGNTLIYLFNVYNRSC